MKQIRGGFALLLVVNLVERRTSVLASSFQERKHEDMLGTRATLRGRKEEAELRQLIVTRNGG